MCSSDLSVPVVLNETIYGLGVSLYPTIMGHLAGSQAILAAYGISGNIERMCTVAVFGVSGATSIIIGRSVGAGMERQKILDIGKTLDTLAVMLGLGFGLFFIGVTYGFFAPVLYPLFGLSAEATKIATMMLVVTFATLGIRAFNNTNVVGVIRGGGDVKTASLIDLSPMWLIAIPVTAVAGLVLHQSIFVVYLCIQLENLFKFFFGLARLCSGKWIKDVTRSEEHTSELQSH